ncbi:12171_t:CDS:2 [Entrophospora sp. SA101]|nr:12171_t:CDS:2 [Entrophospora sp. SA101]
MPLSNYNEYLSSSLSASSLKIASSTSQQSILERSATIDVFDSAWNEIRSGSGSDYHHQIVTTFDKTGIDTGNSSG